MKIHLEKKTLNLVEREKSVGSMTLIGKRIVNLFGRTFYGPNGNMYSVILNKDDNNFYLVDYARRGSSESWR